MTEVRWIVNALLVGFVLGKAFGWVTWSWVWVLAPAWAPLALWVTFGGLARLADWAYLRSLTEEEREAEELSRAFKAYSEALRHERRGR